MSVGALPSLIHFPESSPHLYKIISRNCSDEQNSFSCQDQNWLLLPINTRTNTFPEMPLATPHLPGWHSTLPSKSPTLRGYSSAWFLLPSTTPPSPSPCFSGPDRFSRSPFTLWRSQSLQKRSLRTPQSVPHISSFSCVWSQPPSQHFHSTATPPWVWEVVAFHEFEISPVADFLSSNKPLKRAVRSCGLQGPVTLSPLFWFLAQVLLQSLVSVLD